MPVDFLHAIIAVIFFAVWIVVSQITFGNTSRDSSANTKVRQATQVSESNRL